MEFRVFDPIQWFNYFQLFFQSFIFRNITIRWSMVLLVTKQNMVKKRTVTGQERAGYFKGLSVPYLAFLLLLLELEVFEFADFIL
jgi:hypothetical protein